MALALPAVGGTARAGGDAPDEPPPFKAEPAAPSGASERIKLGALLKWDTFWFPLPGRLAENVDSRNQILVEPELKASFTPNVQAYTRLQLRQDFSDPHAPTLFGFTRNRFFLQEAYLRVSYGILSIGVGRQIFSWGKGDGANPLDLVNPVDYVDLIETEKIAVPSLEIVLARGRVSFTTVVSPVFQPSVFALDRASRWRMLPDFQVTPTGRRVPLEYQVDDGDVPKAPFRDFTASAKLEASVGKLDLLAAYHYTFDQIPTYYRTTPLAFDTTTGMQPVNIRAQHKRIHVFGLGASLAVGKVGFRAEAGYFLTEDPESRDPLVDDPYVKYVVGIDYTLELGRRSVYFNVQYVGDVEVPAQGRRNQDGAQPTFRHFYEQAAVTILEVRFSEFLKLRFKGLINLERFDLALQGDLLWVPYDGFTLALGGDYLDGSEKGFIARFHESSRARLSLSYRF